MTYVYASKVLYTGKCVSKVRYDKGANGRWGDWPFFSFCLLSALVTPFFLFSDFLIF